MACKEVYNNIGSGHYSIAAGATGHRLGLGFSIEWYGPRNLWNVDVNMDFLFFWLAIGYSNWKLDDNRCSALREMLDRMED